MSTPSPGGGGPQDGPRPGEPAVLSYYGTLLTASFLTVLGLVMVFSVRSVQVANDDGNMWLDFGRYGAFAVVGVLAMLGVSRLHPGTLRRWAWPVFALGIVGQALVFTPLGVVVNGNRNWIMVPGVGQVQPSEFLKVGLTLLLGAQLVRYHDQVLAARSLRDLRPMTWGLLAPVVLALGLVLAGGDLGTVIVMAVIVMGALWLSGLNGRWFAIALPVGVLGFLVASFGSANRRGRIRLWLGLDEGDPLGLAYQPVHAVRAIATGRWLGVGLGGSREKWGYLTQAESDYVFAIICEELGLLGALLVIVLLLGMGACFLRTVRRSQDLFVTGTVGAALCWVVGQAVINIGVVVGVLPVLGVPLPLVSRGGSSLISVLLVIGVVLSCARHEPGAAEALSTRGGAVRRTLAVIAPRRRNRD